MSLHPPYPVQSHDLGMQLVPSAQANCSDVQGGRDRKERVDGTCCLLEEFMFGSDKVLRSMGIVMTASGGGDKECSTISSASHPNLKGSCMIALLFWDLWCFCEGTLSSYMFEILLLMSSTWWSPVRSLSCTILRWMLKMFKKTKNCSIPIINY